MRTVACFGQCALAPVVEVDHAIRGHVNEQALEREVDALEKEGGDDAHPTSRAFNAVREAGLAKLLPPKPRIASAWAPAARATAPRPCSTPSPTAIDARGLDMNLGPVGCFGFCAEEPLVNVWAAGQAAA